MHTVAAELTFHRASEPAFGMPEDRLARMAAWQAFVELKASFMRATAEIDGSAGDLLQCKVRQAAEVIDLWGLRHAVMGALPEDHTTTGQHRLELQQQLDNAFPASGTAFMAP